LTDEEAIVTDAKNIFIRDLEKLRFYALTF